jgi:hypothetical protein
VDKTPNRNFANPVLGTSVPLTAQRTSPTQLNTTSTIPNTKCGDDEDEVEDEAGHEDEDGDEDEDEDEAQPQHKPAQAADVEDIGAESGSEYGPNLPS